MTDNNLRGEGGSARLLRFMLEGMMSDVDDFHDRVIGLPVVLVDERLTSQDADQSLREAGVRPKDRRQIEDSVAAQRILEDHFAHEPAHA